MAGYRSSRLTTRVGAEIEKMRRYAREAGRDPVSIGIESWITIASKTPDSWREEAQAWKALGVTHLSVNTMASRSGLARGAYRGHRSVYGSRFRDLYQEVEMSRSAATRFNPNGEKCAARDASSISSARPMTTMPSRRTRLSLERSQRQRRPTSWRSQTPSGASTKRSKPFARKTPAGRAADALRSHAV